MINTLFVDRVKIFRSTIIGAFAYTLFLLGGVWLAMFVDLAHNVSVISLIFVAIYIVMALKWAQSLVELYRLGLQKEPYVTMANEG